MKKLWKLLLAALLISTSVFGNIKISRANEEQKEFIVQEDAYVRKNKGTSNYNFENITSAHGQQYVGKNYRVLNVKRYANSSEELVTMLKFDLPSKEDVEAFDTFELEVNVFKNAGYNNGTQTYQFYYSDDIDWSETSITWDNKPASITYEPSRLIAELTIEKGDEYEIKTEEEKCVRLDITSAVKDWVEAGKEEITIYAMAETCMETSLMIHDRSSGMASSDETGKYASKIIASNSGINLDSLTNLIEAYKQISSKDYTQESYETFQQVLADAQSFVETNPTDAQAIKTMYQSLVDAKNQLVSTLDPTDPDNIAYQKPTRSNLNKDQTSNVTDGKNTTQWAGKYYPSYVDIDLMDTYDLNKIVLNFPENKIIYYTVYGSNDGKNYDEIYENHSDAKKTANGDSIPLENCQYRILRVYIEYTEGDSKAYLSEIRAYGTAQENNTKELRKGTFEEITGIQAYEDTEYAEPITEEETIENVYGIIDRTIGSEYRDWFSFEIAPNTENDYDYYELSDVNGKIHIKGNEGLSLATGLNYYYKNYVNVQISEQTMQVNMPEQIVPIGGVVRKETPLQVRYAFNYCTLSYTFAFFGEEEWQRENDWLALNGVNVVLDLAGQEATWIKFLMNFGYSYDDAKDWLVGPGYQAWQFMQNMEVFGGPLPDGYIVDRVELARSTQRWKNSLGMQTVLQGYAGMVPTNFNEYYEDVELVTQGSWGGFDRPSMIATDSTTYDEFAEKFYAAQEFVYGDTTDYYAVDPFHEGGKRPSGLTDDIIAKEVLESMLEYDPDAIWTVQAWQSNPTNALLNGMGENRNTHVLIVDLIKYPIESWLNYNRTNYTNPNLDAVEFNGTNWAWCLLGNFGGNPTMNGQVETMVNEIQKAKENCEYMVGIGIISEATYDNPMIYDLIFDLAWADEKFNLDTWVKNYIERRYGGTSANALNAWDLILDANYDYGVRLTEEILGLRTGGVPATLGKRTIGYDTQDLENALRLLAEDYDKFKDSEGYRYDLTEIMRQVASNYITLKYHDVIDARDSKDLDAFIKAKEEFLNAFDVLNEVQSTQQDQLGGEWIGRATDLAAEYDDFSRSLFEMNAKSLITTWGRADGNLTDYGFRTYEGQFNDVITARWEEYLDQVEANLRDGTAITVPTTVNGYVPFYWKWVISEQNYTRDAKDSPEEMKPIVDRVLQECVFTGELDPNIGNIALDRVTESFDVAEGQLETINDGNAADMVVLAGNNPEVIIDLVGEFQLSDIQVLLGENENSTNRYAIYASIDGIEWQQIAEKTDETVTEEGTMHEITNAVGRYVKVVGNTDAEHKVLSVKEIRVYGEKRLPELESLQRLVNYAQGIQQGNNNDELFKAFNDALNTAIAALEEGSPDTINVAYWQLYDSIVNMNLTDVFNVALNKPTEASNDPDGHSYQLVDGNMGTNWNSGRLSIPGKPYDHDSLIPGETIIDLGKVYNVNELRIYFLGTDIWYNYEIYGSLDKNEWSLLAEKKTQTVPNEEEDFYKINTGQYRYIRLLTTNIEVEDPTAENLKRNNYNVRELEVYGYEIANMDSLNDKIKAIEDLDSSLYTENSWEEMLHALSKAKEIANNSYAMPSDVNKMMDYLEETQNNLEYKKGDYSLVDEILKVVQNLDSTLYENFDEVENAVENIEYGLNITQQDLIDSMVTSIEEAIKQLKYKPANYSAVDEAVIKAESLDPSLYENYEVLQEAIAKVDRSLNITEQDQVDAMAKAIEDAIKQLKYKPADYTLVDEAIEKAMKLNSENYTNFDSVTKAIAEVDRSLNITEQDQVDAMAKAIEDAMNALQHKVIKIEAQEPTTEKEGNIAYWYCMACDKYFKDEALKEEIALEDTIIPRLPSIIAGADSVWTKGSTLDLSITSNAAYFDFIKVVIDDKDVDRENYMVAEGSTIVTLKAKYLQTLDEGTYTISIVSKNGAAVTKFTIVDQAETDTDPAPDAGEDLHQDTGISNSTNLMFFMALISFGFLAGITVKKYKDKSKC